MNTRLGSLFAFALPAVLLACAGPDDRAPSSPVAGSYRSGPLTLDLEPGGGVRLADARGRVWMRGAHRVDGDVLVLDAYAPAHSALVPCAGQGSASRYRMLRTEDGLRLSPLADACAVRAAAIGRRAWTRLHQEAEQRGSSFQRKLEPILIFADEGSSANGPQRSLG